MIPLRDEGTPPPRGFPIVNITLILINVLVFLLELTRPEIVTGWSLIPKEIITGRDSIGPSGIPGVDLTQAPLGNVYKQSIRDVWYGEEFARFRGELSRIINAGDDWQPDAGADRTVVAMCGGKGAEVCPIKSFYYKPDVPFRRQLTLPAR